MNARHLAFSPEAEDHLHALWHYIAQHADRSVADTYLESLYSHCERILLFPSAGRPREDLRPGVRTTSYRRRTLIVYRVTDDAVHILAVLHGGQDVSTTMDAAE